MTRIPVVSRKDTASSTKLNDFTSMAVETTVDDRAIMMAL